MVCCRTTNRNAREAAIVLHEAATATAGIIGEIAHVRMTEGTDETIGETAQDREAIGGVRGHVRGHVVETGEGALALLDAYEQLAASSRGQSTVFIRCHGQAL